MLISRASSSGRVNDTEAALWTIVVTRSASRVAFGLREPQARRGHVGGDGLHARAVGAGLVAEQVLQHRVDARLGALVAVGRARA